MSCWKRTHGPLISISLCLFADLWQSRHGRGLIWRAKDDRNYYLIRANPLERNIRVYQVLKGVRKMLKNHDENIDARKWHRLRIVNESCRIQVFYDDKPIFDLCDETFKEGKVGLWTKSDAVTYFDELRLSRK